MNQERHGNCWVMRGAIFDFFALCFFCCFLHYWRVVILTAIQATTVVYFLCTGRNEHGGVVVWISARVCLVSACSSSWYVLYLFCAVFLWAPEHLCDHGLDLWDQLMWRFNSIQFNSNKKIQKVLYCVCVWSSLSSDWASTGYGCQSCLRSAEQGII